MGVWYCGVDGRVAFIHPSLVVPHFVEAAMQHGPVQVSVQGGANVGEGLHLPNPEHHLLHHVLCEGPISKDAECCGPQRLEGSLVNLLHDLAFLPGPGFDPSYFLLPGRHKVYGLIFS